MIRPIKLGLLPMVFLLAPDRHCLAQGKDEPLTPSGITNTRLELLSAVLGTDEKDRENWTLLLEAAYHEVGGIREEMASLKQRLIEQETQYWDEFRASLSTDQQRQRFDKLRSDGALDLDLPRELIPCLTQRYGQVPEQAGSSEESPVVGSEKEGPRKKGNGSSREHRERPTDVRERP